MIIKFSFENWQNLKKSSFFVKNSNFLKFQFFFLLIISGQPYGYMRPCTHWKKQSMFFSGILLLSRTINLWIVESIWLILMTFYQSDNLRKYQIIRDDWSSKRQTFKLNNKVKNALTQYVVSIFNSKFNNLLKIYFQYAIVNLKIHSICIFNMQSCEDCLH